MKEASSAFAGAPGPPITPSWYRADVSAIGDCTRPADRGTGRVDWEKLTPRIVAVALVALAAIHIARHGSDFPTYWRAARRFLDGLPLYPASDGLLTYRYSPGVLVFLVPFALLPVGVAKVIWFGLLVTAAAWAAKRLVRTIPGPRPGLAVLIGFVGVSRPFLDEFFYAQVDVLVLALAQAAYDAEDRRREFAAGLLVAIAGGMKLAPFLLAADFLLRRRWRAVAGVASGVAALAVVPIATYGLAGAVAVHREWFHSLTHSATGLVGSEANQGIFGVVAQRFASRPGDAIPPGLPTGVAFALAIAAILWSLRARYPWPGRGLLLFVMAEASPLGWMWNFLLAWPALSLLAQSGRRMRWAIAVFGLVNLLFIYDIVGPDLELRYFLSSIPGIGYLVFFVLLGLRPAPCVAPSASRAQP